MVSLRSANSVDGQIEHFCGGERSARPASQQLLTPQVAETQRQHACMRVWRGTTSDTRGGLLSRKCRQPDRRAHRRHRCACEFDSWLGCASVWLCKNCGCTHRQPMQAARGHSAVVELNALWASARSASRPAASTKDFAHRCARQACPLPVLSLVFKPRLAGWVAVDPRACQSGRQPRAERSSTSIGPAQ